MTDSQADATELARIFFPYHAERTQIVQAAGNRFAYYTSAATAMTILQKREWWLRNARLMNDFSEIAHGMECLNAAYHGPGWQVLREALEACFPGLLAEIQATYNSLVPIILDDTYLTCLSEHAPHEDRRGRLSMWRAYGGRTGVTVVIDGRVMHLTSMALAAFSSPVFYADPPQFATAFEGVTAGIAARCDLLLRVGRDAVRNLVLRMLHFAVLCTKHPAFSEELEWRVIASPKLFSTGRMSSTLEVVKGVPQQVLKIALENVPAEGLIGLDPLELVERIIVGPCEFPHITASAFREQLVKLGAADADSRVTIADVPLRHDA